MCSLCFFFFKQKTAYEMRISDWSSDVCSSDLSLVKSLADEFARDGVTINSVAPGYIMTDTMRRYFEEKYGVADDSVAEWVQSTRGIPAERHGTPEEIGSTIAFLCSRQAGYITGDPAPSHSLSIMRNMSAHFWMPRNL